MVNSCAYASALKLFYFYKKNIFRKSETSSKTFFYVTKQTNSLQAQATLTQENQAVEDARRTTCGWIRLRGRRYLNVLPVAVVVVHGIV